MIDIFSLELFKTGSMELRAYSLHFASNYGLKGSKG